MIIAIDFDETLTRDAALWIAFVGVAQALGHRVVCVTARRDTEENNKTIETWMRENCLNLPVFFTSLGSKIEYMKARGYVIDIWIDDDPRRCALGH